MTHCEKNNFTDAPSCQKTIVQAMRLVPGGGFIFYAAVPRNFATGIGEVNTLTENRRRLVSDLWEHLLANDNSLWEHCRCYNPLTHPMQMIYDPLGRPQLRFGENPGPAISFSTAGAAVWAALCGDKSAIGIDVATGDEFPEDYPIHRVFHAPELDLALGITDGELSQAAALLWSIKEAVAKALGCAFHLVDPRDIHVQPSASADDKLALSVRLSGKALLRFPMADGRRITVRSQPQTGSWLSIAACC